MDNNNRLIKLENMMIVLFTHFYDIAGIDNKIVYSGGRRVKEEKME